jgi:hypothetical protein
MLFDFDIVSLANVPIPHLDKVQKKYESFIRVPSERLYYIIDYLNSQRVHHLTLILVVCFNSAATTDTIAAAEMCAREIPSRICARP